MRSVILLAALSVAAGQDPSALSTKAESLAREGRNDEAEQLWKQAIAVSPDFFPALFDLGYFYYTHQRLNDAALLLRRAADASRPDFNVRYLLGLALSKLGRPEEALRAWREALALEPKNVRLLQIMSVEYSKARYFEDAAGVARRAMELKRDDPNIYFLAIKAYQDGGNDDAAGGIARMAAERFPDSARANFEYAYHLVKKGKLKEAEELLKHAMALDPAYEEPPFVYANLLVDHDRNAEAIPLLETAIRNRRDFVPARVLLSRALMNQSQWEQALNILQETIAIAPGHPQPHLLLSQIYFRLGDEGKAKIEKEISLRLRRENPSILEAPQSRPFPAE